MADSVRRSLVNPNIPMQYQPRTSYINQNPMMPQYIQVQQQPQTVEIIKEVEQPIYIEKYIDREVPVYNERIIEKEVPVYNDRIIEKEVEKPYYIEKIIEKEVPVDRIVEKEVIQYVDVHKQIEVPVYIDRIVEQPVYIDREPETVYVEKPVYIEKQVIIENRQEVETYRQRISQLEDELYSIRREKPRVVQTVTYMEDSSKIELLENQIRTLLDEVQRLNRALNERTRDITQISNYTPQEVHLLKEELAQYKALVNKKNQELERFRPQTVHVRESPNNYIYRDNYEYQPTRVIKQSPSRYEEPRSTHVVREGDYIRRDRTPSSERVDYRTTPRSPRYVNEPVHVLKQSPSQLRNSPYVQRAPSPNRVYTTNQNNY